jgi:hypothetical protein
MNIVENTTDKLNAELGNEAQRIGNAWTEGLETWVYEWTCQFWRPYYINIMFQRLHGRHDQILAQMRRVIECRFYARLVTEFSRRPRAVSQRSRIPKFQLFPDLSVWKKKKVSLGRAIINETLHYNGVMLIPPVSDLNESPVALMKRLQRIFAGHGISRVHVEELNFTVDKNADYAVKTILSGRESSDGIIVLPRTLDELPRKLAPVSPEERALKDAQSSLNLSDETARALLNRTG